MDKQERPYIAYLLRLWQVPGRARAIWRASLEDPHTGERVGFASLEHVVAFLEAQIGRGSQPEEDRDVPNE